MLRDHELAKTYVGKIKTAILLLMAVIIALGFIISLFVIFPGDNSVFSKQGFVLYLLINLGFYFLSYMFLESVLISLAARRIDQSPRFVTYKEATKGFLGVAGYMFILLQIFVQVIF